jgi:hypothetical protein
MFSTEIVNSDPFLDMPSSTQALYFHLGMHADDDGFVYPKKVVRLVSSNDDDLKILLSKKFLLPFENGVMVVKHWKVNNYIRSDRYRPTTHREEIKQITADSGGVYRLATIGIPDGSIGREVGKKESKETSFNPSEQLRGEIADIAKRKRVV